HGEHHKCPMADGDCPHMQHGEGGMSGDKASHGEHHKCEMADGDCPHMQHGEGGMGGEDKPAVGDNDKS
ncbi:MAG: hypothetical protein MUP90_15185, partial [Gammaproteobacteria bacterium]|nr:hypothetical protein [Gammaproteobacteria bacterium]